jgi:acyl carrier protein
MLDRWIDVRTAEQCAPMNEEQFLVALSAFLAEKRGAPVAIAADTDLLQSGLVDSLIAVEILMLIEELSGAPVDPDALEPELFESAGRLYETFFVRNPA